MGKAKKHKILQAKDHLVSGENFSIYWDSTRQRAWTGVEHLDSFDAYYESSDYISHRSKADSLFSLLYVWARGLMLIYKYTLLKKHLQPNSLVGHRLWHRFFFELYEQGFDVFGVESNIKARKICLERNIGVQSTESNWLSKL